MYVTSNRCFKQFSTQSYQISGNFLFIDVILASYRKSAVFIMIMAPRTAINVFAIVQEETKYSCPYKLWGCWWKVKCSLPQLFRIMRKGFSLSFVLLLQLMDSSIREKKNSFFSTVANLDGIYVRTQINNKHICLKIESFPSLMSSNPWI